MAVPQPKYLGSRQESSAQSMNALQQGMGQLQQAGQFFRQLEEKQRQFDNNQLFNMTLEAVEGSGLGLGAAAGNEDFAPMLNDVLTRITGDEERAGELVNAMSNMPRTADDEFRLAVHQLRNGGVDAEQAVAHLEGVFGERSGRDVNTSPLAQAGPTREPRQFTGANQQANLHTSPGATPREAEQQQPPREGSEPPPRPEPNEYRGPVQPQEGSSGKDIGARTLQEQDQRTISNPLGTTSAVNEAASQGFARGAQRGEQDRTEAEASIRSAEARASRAQNELNTLLQEQQELEAQTPRHGSDLGATGRRSTIQNEIARKRQELQEAQTAVGTQRDAYLANNSEHPAYVNARDRQSTNEAVSSLSDSPPQRMYEQFLQQVPEETADNPEAINQAFTEYAGVEEALSEVDLGDGTSLGDVENDPSVIFPNVEENTMDSESYMAYHTDFFSDYLKRENPELTDEQANEMARERAEARWDAASKVADRLNLDGPEQLGYLRNRALYSAEQGHSEINLDDITYNPQVFSEAPARARQSDIERVNEIAARDRDSNPNFAAAARTVASGEQGSPREEANVRRETDRVMNSFKARERRTGHPSGLTAETINNNRQRAADRLNLIEQNFPGGVEGMMAEMALPEQIRERRTELEQNERFKRAHDLERDKLEEEVRQFAESMDLEWARQGLNEDELRLRVGEMMATTEAMENELPESVNDELSFLEERLARIEDEYAEEHGPNYLEYYEQDERAQAIRNTIDSVRGDLTGFSIEQETAEQRLRLRDIMTNMFTKDRDWDTRRQAQRPSGYRFRDSQTGERTGDQETLPSNWDEYSPNSQEVLRSMDMQAQTRGR